MYAGCHVLISRAHALLFYRDCCRISCTGIIIIYTSYRYLNHISYIGKHDRPYDSQPICISYRRNRFTVKLLSTNWMLLPIPSTYIEDISMKTSNDSLLAATFKSPARPSPTQKTCAVCPARAGAVSPTWQNKARSSHRQRPTTLVLALGQTTPAKPSPTAATRDLHHRRPGPNQQPSSNLDRWFDVRGLAAAIIIITQL